jgi:tetratricopeptide (TPR) repeat protein
MRVLLIAILSLFAWQSFAQLTVSDSLRREGFLASQKRDYSIAIRNYEAILSRDSLDYDATLAAARLSVRLKDYDQGRYYFAEILRRDSSDWEAWNGLGSLFLEEGKMEAALQYYQRGVEILPGYVPGYLDLAKALSYDGQLKEAILIYRAVNRIDSTWSEVWAGIGRMYYWDARPATARKYYRKALSLDPQNRIIREEFRQVQQELEWKIKGGGRFFQEKEQTYEINALIQQYGATKRLGDRWLIGINALADYSDRRFEGVGEDQTRWFDNSWAKLSWLSSSHRLNIWSGFSMTDDKVTSYGMEWAYTQQWGGWKLSNSLSGGYEYFFYWNEVGRHLLKNNLQLSRNRWTLKLGASIGSVDEKRIREYSDQPFEVGVNPFRIWSASLGYEIVRNPRIQIGAQYSLMDFDFQSPDYYSPYQRRLAGLNGLFFKKIGSWYLYSNISFNLGTERFYYIANSGDAGHTEGIVNVDNWSGAFELGYNWPGFSLSIGGSRFKNPFYQNLIGFLMLSTGI